MSITKGRFEGDTPFADGQVWLSALDGAVTGTGSPTPATAGSGLDTLHIPASSTVKVTIPLSSLIFRYGTQPFLQEQFGSTKAGGAQGLPVAGYSTFITSGASAGINVNIAVDSSVNFTNGRYVTVGTQNTFIVAIPDSTHITVAALTATAGVGVLIQENLFTTPSGAPGYPPFKGTTELTPQIAPTPKGLYIREIYPVYTVAGAAASSLTIGIVKTVFAFNTAPTVTSVLAVANNGMPVSTLANPCRHDEGT